MDTAPTAMDAVPTEARQLLQEANAYFRAAKFGLEVTEIGPRVFVPMWPQGIEGLGTPTSNPAYFVKVRGETRRYRPIDAQLAEANKQDSRIGRGWTNILMCAGYGSYTLRCSSGAPNIPRAGL